jgi:hypothetical protein
MSDSSIWKRSTWHSAFREKGYVVIDFCDDALIEALRNKQREIPEKRGDVTLYASNYEADYASNERIEVGIKALISESLDQIFREYQFLTGHFMIKAPSPESEFQLHQDWSITDEQTHEVVHLWIPLQDTGPDNGGMFVVEGSHLFFNNLRSGSLDIPRLIRDPYIQKIITPLNVHRGQMLVYHPALFHGSFPNNSNADRSVVLINLLQKDAPLRYYHLRPTNEVEVYTLSKKALMSDLPLMANGGLPIGLSLVEIQPLNQPDNAGITSKDLYKHYQRNKGLSGQSFFQRLFRLVVRGR